MTTNRHRLVMLFNIALIVAVPSMAQTVTPAAPWAIAAAGFADGTQTPGGYVFVAAYGGNSVFRYHGETGMPWPAPGKTGAVFIPGNWSCGQEIKGRRHFSGARQPTRAAKFKGIVCSWHANRAAGITTREDSPHL
jgi:hypothetical protein